MKKIFLYLIIIIACIGIYIGLYFFYIPELAQSTFEHKRDSLEICIKRQTKEAWNNNNALLYFKDYGGAKYLRMDMDAVRLIDSRKDKDVIAWKLFPNGRYADNVRMALKYLDPGSFDDLYDVYYIQCKPWIGTYITPDEDPYNIKVFTYTPMFVGYKKECISLSDYRPSFDKCCQEAKEYIQTKDTDNRMYYSPQNEDKVSKIFNLRNEYFYYQYSDFLKTSNPEYSYFDGFDFANFNFHNHDINAFSFGNLSWIYNSFYKVYYYSQRTGTMYLAFNDSKYSQDIESYISSKRAICNIFLYICLGIIVFLVIMTYYKYKRTNAQNSSTIDNISGDFKTGKNDNTENRDVSIIYETIIKLSNPALFIKPYQPEKLEIANRIYSTALKNRDNVIVLEKLLEEAIKL